MIKKVLLLFVFLGVAQLHAQEKIGLYGEVAYASRSIWHGWDINPDNGTVLHPYLEYGIANSGLSLAFWASLPVNREMNINDDLEFLLRYKREIFSDSRLKLQVNGFIDYILCPNATLVNALGSEQTKMLWKYNAGLAFTNLIAIADEPIVPGYNLYYFSPFGQMDFTSGGVHELSLYYTIPVLSRIKVGGTVNYHTGVFDGGSGWTHATSVISTSVNWGGVVFSGSINKQWSFEKRADVLDEFWITLSASYSL